jgi:hypothetical protein
VTTEAEKPSPNAKALLVEPAALTVVWSSDPADPSAEAAGSDAGGAAAGSSVGEALPMAEALGLEEALREVRRTGVARHLRAEVVHTARGSVALAASVHRLPDGHLLVLLEHAWQARGREERRRRAGR